MQRCQLPLLSPLPALLALVCHVALGCSGAAAGTGVPRGVVAIGQPLEIDRSPRAGLGEIEAEWIAAVHETIHGSRAIDQVRGGLRVASPADGSPLQVLVEILVEPDGRIEDVRLRQATADDVVDQRARSIFARLIALPAPPPALQSDDGLTRLHWRLAREQRGCGEADARVVRLLDPRDEALARLIRHGRHAEAAARLLAEIDRGAVPETQARRLARQILLVAAAGDADPGARLSALLAVARAGDRRAIPALRRLLRAGTNDAACAAGLLADLGATEAIGDLEAALRRNDPATNAPLVMALRALGKPEAATILLPALRDPRPAARLAALHAMAAVPSTTQTGGVVALLADPVPKVRVAAVRVLGIIGGTAAAASLVRHTGHARPQDRAAALHALGVSRHRGPAARWAAAAALNDGSLEVRAAALATLVRIDPDAAMAEINRAFKESTPAKLLATAPVLGEVGGAAARSVLERILRVRREPALRAAASAALGRITAELARTPRARIARGARAAAPAAAPERSADQAAARVALLEIAAANRPQRLVLAARQLPVRHSCAGLPASPGLPVMPPVDCARPDRAAPTCGSAAAGHGSTAAVALANVE